MATFLAALGITITMFVALVAFIIAFATIIALIRIFFNGSLGAIAKISWFLACIFMPGTAFVYFAVAEKSGLLRLIGWVCVAVFVYTAATSGNDMRSEMRRMLGYPASPAQNTQILPDHPQSTDDSTQGI